MSGGPGRAPSVAANVPDPALPEPPPALQAFEGLLTAGEEICRNNWKRPVFIQLPLMRRERDYHWPGSPLEREGGEKTKHKKRKMKEKTAAPHVVLPRTTPADFRHKRGSEGKGGGKK